MGHAASVLLTHQWHVDDVKVRQCSTLDNPVHTFGLVSHYEN